MQIETSEKSLALGIGIKTRVQPFHWLLAASATGNLADGMSLAFLPIIATSISSTPLELSWVDGMRQLPLLFFGLPAGLLLDRVNRRKCIVQLNILRGFMLLVLGAAVATNSLTILSLVTLALLIGSIEAIHDVAAPSVLPEIVEKDHLAKSNGVLSSTETTANYFLGRSFGSSIAVFASTSMASWVAGALYFVAGLLTLPLVQIQTGSASANGLQKRSIKSELKEGFNYVWNDRFLRSLALMGIFGNTAFGAIFATLILFVTEIAKAPDWAFGSIQASFAIGSILLGIRASQIIKKFGEWRTLCICAAIIPLCMLVTPLIPFSATIALTFLVNGGAAVVWNTISISYRQRTTPAHMLGRATAVFRLISWGAMPVGSFIGGIIASKWGLKSPYYFGGVISAINLPLAVGLMRLSGNGNPKLTDKIPTT